MRFKKYNLVIFISILVFSLSGCGSKNIQVSNNTHTDNKIEVTINSEISEYSPFMSSTPGIPLNVKFKEDQTNADIKFHWITEQGTLLTWQQDNGNINVLGKDIEVNDQKIYWSIDPKNKINKSSFKIYLIIEDSNTSKEVYETSIEVEQIKEGFFSIKKQGGQLDYEV